MQAARMDTQRIMTADTWRRAVGKYGYVLVIAAIVLLGAYGALRTPATHGSAGKYIRVNGIMYAAQLTPEVVGLGRVVQATDLGAEFAHIPQDEFPSLLRAGTPVFTVQDYPPHVRLAAFQADELILFEAWNNPAAHHGSDLLDLCGKVSSIGILDDQTDSPGYVEVAALTDQAQVSALTDMVLQAPVEHDVSLRAGRGQPTHWIAWHRVDGTVVVSGMGR
jgi:hypothetical protein